MRSVGVLRSGLRALRWVRPQSSLSKRYSVVTPLSAAVVTCMCAGGFGGGGAHGGRLAMAASPLPWANNAENKVAIAKAGGSQLLR